MAEERFFEQFTEEAQSNRGAILRKFLDSPPTERSRTTMATIKPTVGRVVWFYKENGQGPLAAQIAWVHSDGMVNIGYLDANGLACAATSVSLIQEGDERPTGYYCEWMPYQKGQAAKTEALEKQVAGA